MSFFPGLFLFPSVFTSRSRMTPFSRACFLRLASRDAAAATMPLRMFIGMLFCVKTESFEPRACTRRSVVFCRTRPAAKSFCSVPLASAPAPEKAEDDEEWELFREERRWDSEMRRRSSRSWARREGASSGRGVEEEEEDGAEVVEDVGLEVWSGGREDCEGELVCSADLKREE